MVTTLDELSDKDRKAIVNDLNDLLQLDHDAIEAYTATIERLENENWAEEVGLFKGDHERHVRDLTALIRRLEGKPKEKTHVTGPLKKALVAAGSAMGDRGVLTSFRANELQVKNKYEKYAKKEDYPTEVAEVVRRNAADEKRHYDWVVGILGAK